MDRLPKNIVVSLHVAEAAAFVTVIRSVLVGRWPAVLAALALAAGAKAARRERTWGVGVMLAAATAFSVAAALGFAPPAARTWFWLVGLAGAAPFVLTVKPMMRFDVAATALFAAIAGATGIAGAMAWREAASTTFRLFGCHG
jgi:hypothetical protein